MIGYALDQLWRNDPFLALALCLVFLGIVAGWTEVILASREVNRRPRK